MKNILRFHHTQFFRWALLVFAGILVSFTAFSQSRKLVSKGTNGAPFGYFEYLPSGYSPSSEKKPLIIYLHGAGELGNGSSDLYKMKQRALPKLLQNGKNIPFVVIAPQAPTWWHNHDLLPMLEWVKKQYNIDPTRIYLTGISMGGTKVWDFGGDYPGKVTAILPFGADARNMNACRVSSLPVWAFHGAKDGIYPASAMTAAINKLNNECNPKANPPAKGTVYSDHGHDDLWDHVYNVAHGHDIYKWMLQYKKSTTDPTTGTNKPPVANAGPDMNLTLPQNTAYIKGSGSDADGSISKYWWSKVSGPSARLSQITSPTLKAYDLVAGTYEFELTVTDNKGATGKDRMKLVVSKSGSTSTSTQGLAYQYYEGNWSRLPDFGSLQPKKTGKVSNFTLAPKNRNDYFGFSFNGYIKISTTGTYTFYTKSDDGSKLYINGKQIVDNDEVHGLRERSGSIYLQAGTYPIKGTYFERTGTGENLIVSYSGPGITKRAIPDAVLSTGSSTSTTITASVSDEDTAATEEDKNLKISAYMKQSGLLQISSSEADALLEGEVSIYDVTGRVYKAYLQQGGNTSTWEMATSHLHPGIYILLVREQNGQLHRLRFIQP